MKQAKENKGRPFIHCNDLLLVIDRIDLWCHSRVCSLFYLDNIELYFFSSDDFFWEMLSTHKCQNPHCSAFIFSLW